MVLLSAVFLFFTSVPLLPSEGAESTTSNSSVEGMMAGLSDEQVRQLLIEELKKDMEVEEPAPRKMKGPAFILSRLLRVMSNQHDDSEDEVRALFSALPTMGSDLFRVFVKL